MNATPQLLGWGAPRMPVDIVRASLPCGVEGVYRKSSRLWEKARAGSPDLPVARLDGIERELRLLVDHREDLVAERTRIIARLRWHLHELDPGWTAPTKLERDSAFDKISAHLSTHHDGAIVRRLALRLVEHLRMLTAEIDELTAEITGRVTTVAPSLLAIVGCGALTAAKI